MKIKFLPEMFILMMFLFCFTIQDLEAGREVYNFNADWYFSRGDHAESIQPGFDVSSWEKVRVPHDWAISGPFNPKQGGKTAKLPWRGEGWYRKTFSLKTEDAGKRVLFLFDGVMASPVVWVNGKNAGGWVYGYNSFWLDVTDLVNFKGGNIITVHADTRKHYSRWYPGAGIYRKVTMFLVDSIHIPIWGVFVTTPEVTDKSATVRVRSTVKNDGGKTWKIKIITAILCPDGRKVTESSENKVMPPGGTLDIDQLLTVKDPQLWDVESTKIYTARTIIKYGFKILDNVDTNFGIRTFKWTANDGFHLNGRRVQLKGVDLHHGQGPLGAKFLPRAIERQLEIMKDMGVNALRTSHNMPGPELLDCCDRMGIVVFNEAFDKWGATAGYREKETDFVFKHAAAEIRNFVLRDRNHPSVFVWSIGNEIGSVETNRSGRAPEMVAYMVKQFKRFDPTRPDTMGCLVSGAVKKDTHVLDSLDITSWNYGRKYLRAKERYPGKPIIYSESASALSTRGFYELPHPRSKTDYSDKLQVDSYDLNSASGPRDIPDLDFYRMEKDRYVAGEFVWTGFDYLGEPTPFSMQARSSYFGIVDLCGIPKDRYYIYRSHWRPTVTTVHIVPHWNWKSRMGKKVPVYVYTNGDEAELFLNGRSVGRKRKKTGGHYDLIPRESSYYSVIDRYRLRWEDVIYEPGELKVVAYKDGKKIGEAIVKTAGRPAKIRLTPDRKVISADGDDLCYVLVEMLDKSGNLCPKADNMIKFKVEGPMEIAATGNGNPLSLEPFVANQHKLFFGKAMLILRSIEGSAGQVNIRAEAEGIASAESVIECHALHAN